MGMFIRTKNATPVTTYLEGIIPTHSCGNYGRLPEENFGRALSRLFPHACVYKHGDPLTPSVLKMDGCKFSPAEEKLILSLPTRVTLDKFWEHLYAPKKSRQTAALSRIAAACGLEKINWIHQDETVIIANLPFSGSMVKSVRAVRKVIRKDDYKMIASGVLNWDQVELRPF